MELLQGVKDLAPVYRARPSALMPLASAAGFCLGAASALLPARLSSAVSGQLYYFGRAGKQETESSKLRM